MDRPNAERYRALAAKCAEIAEKAIDPRIKTFSQAAADSWLRLAELVEKPSERAGKPIAGDGGV
jgi:hypothetical protein